MKSVLLAGIVLISLVAAPAVAADLSARPNPPSAAVYNWTGCYLGGNGGALISDKEWFDAAPGSPTFGVSYGAHSPNDVLLGLQGGCDLEAGGWLIGVAGDYGLTVAHDSNRNRLIAAISDRSRIRSLATATARLGYAWERYLGYIKGGIARERDDYDQYLNGTEFVTATAGETRSGWTAGFGAEVAFLPPVSGFIEANYYSFGHKVITFTPATGGATFPIDIKDRKVVVRGGINWRFGGGGAPVVAKF